MIRLTISISWYSCLFHKYKCLVAGIWKWFVFRTCQTFLKDIKLLLLFSMVWSSGVPDQGPVYWRLISAINLKSNYNPDSFIPLFMGTISLFPVEHPVIKLKTIRVILNFLPRLPDLKSDFTLIQDYLNLDLKKPAPHSFVLIPEFSLKKSTILLGLWRRMSK